MRVVSIDTGGVDMNLDDEVGNVHSCPSAL